MRRKLRRAFDTLPVDLRHYVVFLQAGFCRRAVRNNLSQHYAAFAESFSSLALSAVTSCVSTPSQLEPSSPMTIFRSSVEIFGWTSISVGS